MNKSKRKALRGRTEHYHFINALRGFLGLDPLPWNQHGCRGKRGSKLTVDDFSGRLPASSSRRNGI